MFVVQVGQVFSTSDEKLASVCVWAAVGHREETCVCVFNLEVFIRKIFAPECTQASRAVTIEVVTALNHEVFDNSVKN